MPPSFPCVEPVSELPLRERLFSSGATSLGEAELLLLLMDRGPGGVCAARELLRCGGGLRAAARSSAAELAQLPGIGRARAVRLAVVFELARRLEAQLPRRGMPIRSGADVFRLLHARWRDLRKEVFVALLLDGKNRLLREERVSEGSLTSSIVHPREVFSTAIRESAGALVVAHNHPSGDPTPSREDLEVTTRLAEAGRIVGITLLDHVIVGDPGYVSLRERGYLAPAEDRD